MPQFVPDVDEKVFTCACGNQRFYISHDDGAWRILNVMEMIQKWTYLGLCKGNYILDSLA